MKAFDDERSVVEKLGIEDSDIAHFLSTGIQKRKHAIRDGEHTCSVIQSLKTRMNLLGPFNSILTQ